MEREKGWELKEEEEEGGVSAERVVEDQKKHGST